MNHSGRLLSSDELRILNIVLVEYIDKLNDVGLYFESDQPSTDQPAVTKKRVVECLQQIGQPKLGGILSKRQGRISSKVQLPILLDVCIHTYYDHSFVHRAYSIYGNEFASTIVYTKTTGSP